MHKGITINKLTSYFWLNIIIFFQFERRLVELFMILLSIKRLYYQKNTNRLLNLGQLKRVGENR